MTSGGRARLRIACVLDDVAAAAAPLAWSAVLARALQRELLVVQVESEPALAAAALPATRVLAHPGAEWAPFDLRDVERAYRVQRTRAQQLVQQACTAHHIRGSLEVKRGTLHHAAMDIGQDADLVLVAGAAPMAFEIAQRSRQCHSVLTWADESPPGSGLTDLAAQCASSLGATHCVMRVRPQADALELLKASADLLVVPRARLPLDVLARARRPLLLVGLG